jgi:hypothetical protein
VRRIVFKRLAFSVISYLGCSELFAQDSTEVVSRESGRFALVEPHRADVPRATPLTREAMKQYLEDLKDRKPRIPLPPLTEEEAKKGAEDPRAIGYESRIRSLYIGEASVGSYLAFGGPSASAGNDSANGIRRALGPSDPRISLDYGFKVRLFWLAARANNCQYCLGHQESKLLVAGMSEDEIAALDSDWDYFPVQERVAFALAKTLTGQPHLVDDDLINTCKKYYSDQQLVEMLGAIAGYNAINRWKEGAGVPQSHNGGNFGGSSAPKAAGADLDVHTYLTPTSDKFRKRISKVVAIDGGSLGNLAPTVLKRPALETGELLASRLDAVSKRTCRIALVDEAATRSAFGELVPGGSVPTWMRLVAHFPIAGKRFVESMLSTKRLSELSPALQAEIDWVVARQDRAWYAAKLAKGEMAKAGVSVELIEALDRESFPTNAISERDRVLLVVAKNLAGSPIVLTDAQVEKAVELAGPRAVTQVIHYTAYRAAFNRLTEAALLSDEAEQ